VSLLLGTELIGSFFSNRLNPEDEEELVPVVVPAAAVVPVPVEVPVVPVAAVELAELPLEIATLLPV
jgi:hypothetical protein